MTDRTPKGSDCTQKETQLSRNVNQPVVGEITQLTDDGFRFPNVSMRLRVTDHDKEAEQITALKAKIAKWVKKYYRNIGEFYVAHLVLLPDRDTAWIADFSHGVSFEHQIRGSGDTELAALEALEEELKKLDDYE